MFSFLPKEMIWEILVRCDIVSLGSMAKTSHFLNTICDESIWRHVVARIYQKMVLPGLITKSPYTWKDYGGDLIGDRIREVPLHIMGVKLEETLPVVFRDSERHCDVILALLGKVRIVIQDLIRNETGEHPDHKRAVMFEFAKAIISLYFCSEEYVERAILAVASGQYTDGSLSSEPIGETKVVSNSCPLRFKDVKSLCLSLFEVEDDNCYCIIVRHKEQDFYHWFHFTATRHQVITILQKYTSSFTIKFTTYRRRDGKVLTKTIYTVNFRLYDFGLFGPLIKNDFNPGPYLCSL